MQYNFIIDQIGRGKTILAYLNGGKPKHIKSTARVALCDNVLFIDGQAAHGWTICVRP